MDTKLFRITSDFMVSDIMNCDLLEQKLPGEMGAYFYPEDAVIECLDGDVKIETLMTEYVKQWESKQREEDSERHHTYQLTHSVALEEVHEDEFEEEEEEEEEAGNESNSECSEEVDEEDAKAKWVLSEDEDDE